MRQITIENTKIALRSIKSNLLRTILTMLIIAVGIMALVGILTAVDAIKYQINSDFTRMGANTFSIRNRGTNMRMSHNGIKPKVYRKISYAEAMAFKEDFSFPSTTSVSAFATHNATLKYKSQKTDPNVGVLGADENYLFTSGKELAMGRNFDHDEIHNGSHVVIIGSEIIKLLFSENEVPLGKIITIGNGKYKVIGVLKEKGSSFGFSGDKHTILPLSNVRQYFPIADMSFTIEVMVTQTKLLDAAIGEAIGLFRVLRKVPIKEDSNFEITKSDNLANMLIDKIKYVTMAATFIGIITLLGAAIGLMNIMLVSVSERTREIGTRKALGATSKNIKQQFLIEAIVIGQLGGLFGIILGILIGNIMTFFLGGKFIIPWLWILSGFALCFIVGVVSGLFPATKAAKLDPIEALRYE